MQTNSATRFCSIATTLALSVGFMATASAHGDHEPHLPGSQQQVHPIAILQLEEVRQATARYLDVDAALADGYVDIGAFVPNMGWHYLKPSSVDARFDPKEPEVLVYADDPCSSKRRLVAAEYAIPLELSKRAPQGFAGRADEWHANQALGMWTLHAWVWEYNPDGVFAAMNPRVR